MLGIVIGAVASAGILILFNKDPVAVKQLKEEKEKQKKQEKAELKKI